MRRDCWLGIELRHFAALEAIAKEQSFRAAANRLGYLQSAISRQIAYLEQTTGKRLIARSQGPRPVHLTEAGHLLLEHANDILASIEAAWHRNRRLPAAVSEFRDVIRQVCDGRSRPRLAPGSATKQPADQAHPDPRP